ncbi:MAG TPA: DUF6804 family protein [Phycisphaerales bacterium]|nr:DUF6804 family protein [Phycisphaerales bacterium]
MQLKQINNLESFAWGIVCCGIVVWIAIYGYEDWLVKQEFDRTAISAEAVVTKLEPGFRSRDDAEPSMIDYVFATPDGREFEGSGEAYITEGERVEIRYQPDNPAKNWLPVENGVRRQIANYGILMLVPLFIAIPMLKHSVDSKGVTQTRSTERFFIILGCCGCAALLLSAAWGSHGRIFYLNLRWIVSVLALILGTLAYRWYFRWLLPSLCGAIAVVFNPLVPFYFSREVWRPIDLASAVVLVIVAAILKPREISITAKPS